MIFWSVIEKIVLVLAILGFLGINQWDKASSYFNRTLCIYKSSSEKILDQSRTVYLTKLRIGNDFSPNTLNTDNISEKPYLDYSSFTGKIEKLFIMNADNVEIEVNDNIEKKRIYLNFKYMEYTKEVFLLIITDKYLDYNNLIFQANLVGTTSEPKIQDRENIITQYKNFINIFLLILFVAYHFWKLKKEADSHNEHYNEIREKYAEQTGRNVEKGNQFEQEIINLKSTLEELNKENMKLTVENMKLQVRKGK